MENQLIKDIKSDQFLHFLDKNPSKLIGGSIGPMMGK